MKKALFFQLGMFAMLCLYTRYAIDTRNDRIRDLQSILSARYTNALYFVSWQTLKKDGSISIGSTTVTITPQIRDTGDFNSAKEYVITNYAKAHLTNCVISEFNQLYKP